MIAYVILWLAASTTFEQSYRAGLHALQANQLTEARSNLENAAKVEPGKSRVWLALAQTYWKLRETGKADEAAEKAARLASGDAQVLKFLAVYYSETERWLRAGDFQAEYAAAAPGDRDALPQAMEFYLRAQAPERAIAVGKRTAGTEQRADVRHLLGKAYADAGQPDAAATEFQAAINLEPYQESYYFDFANNLLHEQKYETAIEVLQSAKRNFDKSAQIELALGVAAYGLRRYADAATAFERTITLAPEIEQPYVFLGKMLDQVPAKVPGLTALFAGYEKAHPDNYAGYLLHAKALMAQSSEPDLPAALLRKACSLDARQAEPHYQLGVLLQRERKFVDAAKEFEGAAALDPNDPATHYHLAQVYDRLDRRDDAAKERDRHSRLMQAGSK